MSETRDVLDRGPFFHGTKAELQIGDLLEPQHVSIIKTKSPTTSISPPL